MEFCKENSLNCESTVYKRKAMKTVGMLAIAILMVSLVAAIPVSAAGHVACQEMIYDL